MSNVAHFMADLACDPTSGTAGSGQMPVVMNDTTAGSGAKAPTTSAAERTR